MIATDKSKIKAFAASETKKQNQTRTFATQLIWKNYNELKANKKLTKTKRREFG